MNRAYSVLSIDEKSFDDEQRVFKGIASTPRPDRVDDVVEPLGAVFSLPMPLLLDHDSRSAVGHVEFAKPTKAGIPFEARIVKFDEPGEVKNLVDKAWHLVKTRLRPAVSIGFRALKDGVERMDNGGYKYNSWEWLELSLVVIPANADAVVFAKSLDDALDEIKSIDSALLAASGRKQIGVVRLDQTLPGVSGTATPKTRPKEGLSQMTIKTYAEQITALEAMRAAKDARRDEIQSSVVEAGRTKDASEREEFETLRDEIKALDEELSDLRDLERSKAASAKPVGEVKNAIDAATARAPTVTGGQYSPAMPVKHEEKLDKGIPFVRFVSCVALGKGNLMQSLEIAKERYGESHDIVGMLKYCVQRGTSVITKAPTAAATTGDSAWAGALVPLYQRYAGDFVDFLRPMSILGKLGQNGIPGPTMVPFNINIAGQTSGATGYWVGEAQAKPVTRAGFNNVNLGWYKVAAICVLSEELVRFSSPNAETLMRNELARAVVERMDIDFVDPNKVAVAGVSPASITNGVTPVNSTGNDADAIRNDIAQLMLPYINANMPLTGGVWIMSSARALRLSLMYNPLGQREFPNIEMGGGTFAGFPVISSEYVTSDSNGDDVIFMSAPDIWLADDGEVAIDVSREASLQMQDNPTNDSANGGNPTATSLVSLWQTDSIGIRCERFANWAKRRNQAVQLLGNVNWGEPGSS